MQAGALVMLLGTPIALGSWWGLLAVAAMVPALIWRLFEEENSWQGTCLATWRIKKKCGTG